jgi:hypothetical protein
MSDFYFPILSLMRVTVPCLQLKLSLTLSLQVHLVPPSIFLVKPGDRGTVGFSLGDSEEQMFYSTALGKTGETEANDCGDP